MLKEKAKLSLLKHGELFVEGVLADLYEDALKEAVAKVKLAIPGQVDDLVFDLVVANLGPALKAEFLKQVEKISEEV